MIAPRGNPIGPQLPAVKCARQEQLRVDPDCPARGTTGPLFWSLSTLPPFLFFFRHYISPPTTEQTSRFFLSFGIVFSKLFILEGAEQRVTSVPR